MDEEIWQEHVYVLEKAPGVGFGIAISGGKDSGGFRNQDDSIFVSDVIKGGPAFDKIKINDIVVRVNGKPMYNINHEKAVKELKNAGHRVELMIKRKVIVKVTPPRSRHRELDSPPRRRSRSRGSRDREWNDSRRRHRSRSRDLDSLRDHRRSYRRSRSSSRGRSRSRTPSRKSYSRGSTPSYRRERSKSRSNRGGRSRSRTPSYERGRSRTPSRKSLYSSPSRSPSPRRRSHSRTNRIRSIEDLRNTMSPLSPDPDSPVSDPDMMVFTVKQRDPKTVVLKKTRQNNSYGLKLGTRIFIQDILPNSLADRNKDLNKGDTVLMINGRNVDNKMVEDAIKIIGLSKEKVTMLVKKEEGGTVSLPTRKFRSPANERKEIPHENSRSRRYSRKSSTSKASSKSIEPAVATASRATPKPMEKKQPGGIRVLPTTLTSRARSESSNSLNAPEPAPRSKHNTPDREYSVPPGTDDDQEEEDGQVLPPTARRIVFTKEQNIGIRLAGGNDVGIFVASVQENSPAASQGLKIGDQILSVNEVSFRNIIREEAVLTLMGLPTGATVNIIAQPQAETYKKVLEMSTGDSFYIRTHFKYEKSSQHELSFKKGSTFRISDTLYQGTVGFWLAVRIGRNNMEVERGVIPNSSRAEQMKAVQDKKLTQGREKKNQGISRRIKNQKPDVPASAAISAMFPAYERVVLREAGFKRPVCLFGPLADIARERLEGDYHHIYEIAHNEGLVRGQKSNRKGVIRLNTIKDIIEKDKHAILDITPTAVEKLNYAQLYPIVVFLEASSKAMVKDLRSKLATTEAEKKKKSGKLFDRSMKLQRGYCHVFTDTIRLGEDDNWYKRLHSTIKDQQSMPVWVSKDKLGGGDEIEEGVTVPGDDDQLSYVSAPASDYSVTTVGSDILNNSRILEEDVTPITKPVISKRPSTSSEENSNGGKFGDDDFGDMNEPDGEPPLDHVVTPPSPSKIDPVHVASKTSQNVPQSVRKQSSISSSSVEEPTIPKITPKQPTSYSNKRVEPTRGSHEIPAGRFDPQSFLQNHIRSLKSVSSSEHREEPVSVVRSQPTYNPPPTESKITTKLIQPMDEQAIALVTARPFKRPEPVQPVYAQVNRNRPKQMSYSQQPDRRDIPGVEHRSGFTQPNEQYRSTQSRLLDERPPIREEPVRHVPSSQSRPTYNRFPGTQHKSEQKPYQPYNQPKSTSYQRPAVANGVPQKSNFVQDPYSNSSDPYSNNRSYGNPPTSKLNPTNKEQMYDSGVDTYYNSKAKKDTASVSPPSADDDDPQVVATARGSFDSNGGVLSSVETGVSIVIPKGAIRPGVRQEIYFKVCRDNTAIPPLDKNKGETLLSPLVMCGPHGLQFDHPVELRLPHCEPSQWSKDGNDYDSGSNSVSVLIDHF